MFYIGIISACPVPLCGEATDFSAQTTVDDTDLDCYFWMNIIPADTRRNNNVIITPKRRRFDVIMVLSLRRVPADRQMVQFAVELSVIWESMWVNITK